MGAYDMQEWRYNSTYFEFGSRWVQLLASRPIRLTFRERVSGTIHWTAHGYQSKHCVMGEYDMQEWRYNSRQFEFWR